MAVVGVQNLTCSINDAPFYQKPVFRYRFVQYESCVTDDQSWILVRGKHFSFRCRVQTVSTAQAASPPIGAGNPFPEVKREDSEAEHSPLFSAVFKNTFK